MKQLPFLLATLMLLVVQPARSQSDAVTATDERGWLGVLIRDVSPQVARALQMQRPQGALVVEVTPGGPAERAGLHPGDVILSLNGEAIDERGELPRLIAQQPAGALARLEIWRAGNSQSVDAELGSRPGVPPAEAAVRALAAAGKEPVQPDGASQANGQALGLQLRVLAPAEARAMNIGFGLLIERIAPAARAPQLEPGDVIVGINNEEFSSVEEFNALVAKHAAGSSVALRVRRGLEAQYVAVKVQG